MPLLSSLHLPADLGLLLLGVVATELNSLISFLLLLLHNKPNFLNRSHKAPLPVHCHRSGRRRFSSSSLLSFSWGLPSGTGLPSRIFFSLRMSFSFWARSLPMFPSIRPCKRSRFVHKPPIEQCASLAPESSGSTTDIGGSTRSWLYLTSVSIRGRARLLP